MRQAKAAEDQIAVAKDTEQRQLRAYVFVDHVQTTNIDDDLTIDDPTKLQSVTVVFKNSGLTPAYNVKQIASLKFTDFPPNQAVFVHDLRLVSLPLQPSVRRAPISTFLSQNLISPSELKGSVC